MQHLSSMYNMYLSFILVQFVLCESLNEIIVADQSNSLGRQEREGGGVETVYFYTIWELWYVINYGTLQIKINLN